MQIDRERRDHLYTNLGVCLAFAGALLFIPPVYGIPFVAVGLMAMLLPGVSRWLRIGLVVICAVAAVYSIAVTPSLSGQDDPDRVVRQGHLVE
jgi:hypothetical protein